jgi:hypothetical protein
MSRQFRRDTWLTVRVTQRERRALEEAAAREEITGAELVREAVRREIRRRVRVCDEVSRRLRPARAVVPARGLVSPGARCRAAETAAEEPSRRAPSRDRPIEANT